LVYFTKIVWIDSVVALILGIYIILIGYKIIRKSLSGIMDEADPENVENAKFPMKIENLNGLMFII
jgi:divalent metal cation (Fe/Co/Zn/Cd) transporter